MNLAGSPCWAGCGRVAWIRDTRSEKPTNYILPSGQLRFSRIQDVNDPRESKDWLFNYFSTLGSLPSDTRSIGSALNARLKHWRIGCFTLDSGHSLKVSSTISWVASTNEQSSTDSCGRSTSSPRRLGCNADCTIPDSRSAHGLGPLPCGPKTATCVQRLPHSSITTRRARPSPTPLRCGRHEAKLGADRRRVRR